jgi:predicted secreted protein with PEFG-CTERM motif
MKSITLSSFFILFAIISGLTIPNVFAEQTAVVKMAEGSGVPGCEETTDGCFIPMTVTVEVRGEVTWSNTDSAAHTVTSGTAADGPDGNFDSGLLIAGQSFEWIPEQTGEYPYFCMVHPWMTGTVIVEGLPGEEELTVTITDSATDDGIQVDLEFNQVHVNYEITATQNGNVVWQETGHAHLDMMGSHQIPVVASDDNPVDIEVVSLGIGLPGEEATWSSPIDETVATKQIVPEFGTIAMMILGVAIVSIIAISAKSRVIPRI